jgi:membrane dipeptidase
MFNLTPEQEQRAMRLHHEATVIDSLGGYEEYTVEMKKRIDAMIAQKIDYLTLMEKIAKIDAFEIPQENGEEWETARRASGVSAISLTMGPYGKEMFSFENAVKDIAIYTYKFDTIEKLIKVCSSKDIERAKREDKLGLILNFQNSTHIGSDVDNIDFFYSLGIRQIQMTYNDLNLVGAGCTERRDCGLSRFGVKVVERMNKLGILIDLAHTGFQTSMDVIEVSSKPVAFTHTVCKAVYDHDRGKTDEQLDAIARKNGYVGIVTVPMFISPREDASLEDFLKHIDHAASIVGTDKLGIGTDQADSYPPLAEKMNTDALEKLGFQKKHGVDMHRTTKGYRGWSDFPNLTRSLVSSGYKDEEVKGILGGNFLRIFAETVG